jgi:hypothetical protein
MRRRGAEERRWSPLRRTAARVRPCDQRHDRLWLRRLPRAPAAAAPVHRSSRASPTASPGAGPTARSASSCCRICWSTAAAAGRGFPLPVVRELQRLREFNAQQRVGRPPEGWWDRLARSDLALTAGQGGTDGSAPDATVAGLRSRLPGQARPGLAQGTPCFGCPRPAGRRVTTCAFCNQWSGLNCRSYRTPKAGHARASTHLYR